MSAGITFRQAKRSDAGEIALLVNMATHGLTSDFWGNEKAEAAYSPIEIGRIEVLKDDDTFSWRKATMAESGGEVVGMLLGGPGPDTLENMPAETPPFLKPFYELGSHAPDAWYINVVAVHIRWRRKGIGEQLLDVAAALSSETGAREQSLIVEDANEGARRLYEGKGFAIRARVPVVRFPGGGPNALEWLLMVKE